MSKKEKLIARIKGIPTDFSFEELVTLLGFLGFRQSNKGKTSGSRVIFILEGKTQIIMHKPHGNKNINSIYLREIVEKLLEEGLI